MIYTVLEQKDDESVVLGEGSEQETGDNDIETKNNITRLRNNSRASSSIPEEKRSEPDEDAVRYPLPAAALERSPYGDSFANDIHDDDDLDSHIEEAYIRRFHS